MTPASEPDKPAFIAVLPEVQSGGSEAVIGVNEKEQLQEMEVAVRSQAVAGVRALGLRTALSLVLRMLSGLVLARLLSQKDYGLFGVVSTIAGLGGYLCDFGLGQVLVMQDRAPTKDEGATVFWFQQGLTTLVVLATIATSHLVLTLYTVNLSVAPLLVVAAFGLYFSSLRVIPVMALERNLQFDVLAKWEFVENVVQVASGIALAVAGMGAWSLVLSGIVGRSVGLIGLWNASPWQLQYRFRWEIVRRLARVGILFQVSALAPTLLRSLIPIVITRVLGVNALGTLTWAANLASIPHMLGATLNRVAFPSFSRLQDNPEQRGRAVVESIRLLNIALHLIIVPVVLAVPLALPIVFGSKWTTAIPAVQLGLLEAVPFVLVNLLAQVQGAAGRPQDPLLITIIDWCIRVAVVYIGASTFGVNGVAAAYYFVILCDVPIIAYLVRRNIPGCAAVPKSIIGPIFSFACIAGLSISIGRLVTGGHNDVGQTVIALFIFIGLSTVYNQLTPERPLTSCVARLLRLVAPKYAAKIA